MHPYLLFLCIGAIAARSKERSGASLSDVVHEVDGHHNVEYDHEAFLGKEQAKEFDELTPEESKRRLRKLVIKIDADSDGFVSEVELHNWVIFVHNRYLDEQTEKYWKDRETTGDDHIEWEEYVMAHYKEPEDELKNRTDYDFTSRLKKDKRRWTGADSDGDNSLSREEFRAYVFPQEFGHMKSVVGIETLEEVDQDKDGFVSEDEFILDMLTADQREDLKKGIEPEWLKDQREYFRETRDQDKDGKMNEEEVGEWIMPTDYDAMKVEAQHLMHNADQNDDKQLTMDEIMEQYELFVGSKATDFGEALKRHDEF